MSVFAHSVYFYPFNGFSPDDHALSEYFALFYCNRVIGNIKQLNLNLVFVAGVEGVNDTDTICKT